jgi:sugar lactone lactonase YvrE
MFISATVFVLALSLCHTAAQVYNGPQDPRLTATLTLDTPSNGISTTADGRLFVLYARVDGSSGPQVVEYNLTDNDVMPFPDKRWNSYTPGKDPANYLVRINSQRVGPDGSLWLVDVGSPSFGAPVILPEGPKLVQVDLKTDQVTRVYPMGNVTRSESLRDDVRFNLATGKAYLTDAGAPGLIVLDLAGGVARRVLENDLSTREYIPASAEGTLMHGPDGGFLYIYADQLEVSPDATWLYYQPASGGMSRIKTSYLDMAFYNSSLSEGPLSSYVEPYAHTLSTGGTSIDADGNIYTSDTDSQRILKIWPNGTMTTLVQDPRLTWVDAMWIDAQNRLWMPAAQLNRGEPSNSGTNHIVKPLHVYTIEIGVGPSPIDHA